MGKKGRELRERVAAGLQAPFRNAIKLSVRHEVIQQLTQGSGEEQSARVNELVGTGHVSASKVGQTIMDKAPAEMDKAIRKFQKEGKPITVESLTAEAKSTPSFVKMCQNSGIRMEWFEELARQRMAKLGVRNEN